jgi:UPF0716 protein FxsA
LFGAVLMLIPGYLTDAAGLVMFLPGIRTIVGALLLRRMTARGGFIVGGRMPFGVGTAFGSPAGVRRGPGPGSGPGDGLGGGPGDGLGSGGDIIEGDFEERSNSATPTDKKD